MSDLGTLTVNFAANTNPLTAGIGLAQKAISGLANMGPIGMVGAGLLAVGAVAIAVGAKTVKMAGDFQSSMTSLVTGAGESQKNIGLVGDGILALAGQTGTATKDLAAGMYMIESAGYHGAAGLLVLKAAAEGAKVGNASLADVANGVTTAMTDYSKSGLTAAQATNTLIATVAQGKTHMGDLAKALSTILPSASAAGVGLNDVMGAMATMTGEGVPAAQAATFLRQTILGLVAPSAGTVKALQSVGLTTAQVSDEMKKSLPDALKMITDAVGKKFPEGSAQYVDAIKKISGGSKTMQGMLDLTGDHMKTFVGNVGKIGSAVKSGGSSIQGWSLIQQDFNQRMAQARGAMEAFGITIGTALLPVISNMIGGLNTVITAIGRVVGFFQQNEAAALSLLVPLGALGGYFVFLGVSAVASFIAAAPAMIAGFIAGAAAAWTMAAGVIAATWPFLLIGAAIGLLVIGIILLVQHWGTVVSFLSSTWASFASWFMGALTAVGAFFTSVWNGIITGLRAAWDFIVNVVKIGMLVVFGAIFAPIIAIVALFAWLYAHNTYFKELMDAIVNFVKVGTVWLVAAWQNTVTWLAGAWQKVAGIATAVWSAIAAFITAEVGRAVSWLQGAWTSAVGFLGGIWTTIATGVSQMWSTIAGFFASAWGTYISGPLTSLWAQITGFVSGWAGQAVQWGVNLIQGFINGIMSMLGSVGSAIGNVASTVANFLGFHSPVKEGPGRDLDVWGPNMVKGFARGVTLAKPILTAALNMTLSPFATLSTEHYSQAAGGSGGTASGVAPGPVTIIIEQDGRPMAKWLAPHLVGELRLKTGAR